MSTKYNYEITLNVRLNEPLKFSTLLNQLLNEFTRQDSEIELLGIEKKCTSYVIGEAQNDNESTMR